MRTNDVTVTRIKMMLNVKTKYIINEERSRVMSPMPQFTKKLLGKESSIFVMKLLMIVPIRKGNTKTEDAAKNLLKNGGRRCSLESITVMEK